MLRIETSWGSETDKQLIKELASSLGENYPTAEMRKSWQDSLLFRTGKPPKRQSTKKAVVKPDAVRFTSSDNTQVVFWGTEGFSYSQLKPYPGWTPFIGEARRIWNASRSVAKPNDIRAVDLRFINSIKIPLPAFSVEDYLVTPPAISESVTDTLSGFMTKVVFQDKKSKATVSFTQMTEPPFVPGTGALILDIEVSLNLSADKSDKDLWSTVESLRAAKNRVFFGSVTEKLLEMYE